MEIFDGDSLSGCMYKKAYSFEENSAYFALKIELILTMFFNFEREAALDLQMPFQIFLSCVSTR